MDMYKKKSLKFDKNLGLGRNLRAVERSTARAESRHTRFSLLRCLEDETENQPIEKNEEPVRRIPTFGKPNLKAPMSRADMLQKWKEEKQIKRQQELKSKKPTFKAGIVAPKPFQSFVKTANGTPSKSDSRLKTSGDSRMRFNNKSNSKTIKETSIQPSFSFKSQVSSNNAKLLNSKESIIQSSNRKIPLTKSNSLKMKQEPHIQLPNKSNTTLQKPSLISTKQVKNQETRTQMPIKSQIVPKKTSYTTATKEFNSKLHSLSGVQKVTESRNLKPPQMLSNGLPRKNQNRIPEPTKSQMEFHSQLPNKSKTALQKPSFISTRQTKTEINSCKIGKEPEKTATKIKQTGIPHKNGIVPKPQCKNNSRIGLPAKKKGDNSNITFRCELSHIEPSEDKSFAPKGFLFQPPTELSFSFLEDGITAIFSKLRAGTERTSTPKRADLREIEEKIREKSSPVTDEVFSPKVQDPVDEASQKFSENLTESKMKEKEYIPIEAASDSGEEKKTSVADQDSSQEIPKQSDINKYQTEEKSCTIAENIFKSKLDIKNQHPDLNLQGISSPVFEESPLAKDFTTPEFPKQQKIDFHEKRDNVNLLEASFPVFEEKNPVLGEVTTSECTQLPKSDLFNDEVPTTNPKEFPEDKKSVDLKDFLKQELNLEEHKMQDSALSLPEASSSTFEGRVPLLPIDVPSNAKKLQKKELLPGDDILIITRNKPFTRSNEIKTRSFRRSEMPLLESINESLENSSLLESPPKPRKKEPLKKSTLCKDFTPRRSLRLAKLSEPDSPECLFDVRPSFYATPPDSKNSVCNSSNLTYDFDNLHLEVPSNKGPPVQRQSTRKGKVSLLYTPPTKGRVSTVRKSIKGDLMSFSPDV